MDKPPRPSRLEIDPNDFNASHLFEIWLSTFESFLTAAEASGTTTIDKLALLKSYLSPRIDRYIKEVTSYEVAILRLQNTYMKKKNATFARHLLATRVQGPEESLMDFIHGLRDLAEDCDFRNVDGETYKREMIRDAFISGLRTQSVRQTLLKEPELDLKSAVERAEILDRAQSHCASYSCLAFSLPAIPRKSNDASTISISDQLRNAHLDSPVAINFEKLSKAQRSKLCFCCGENFHAGARCPAADEYCHTCRKKGHLQKVCGFKGTNEVTACVERNKKQGDQVRDVASKVDDGSQSNGKLFGGGSVFGGGFGGLTSDTVAPSFGGGASFAALSSGVQNVGFKKDPSFQFPGAGQVMFQQQDEASGDDPTTFKCDAQFKPVLNEPPPLVEVKTGEEGEQVLFKERCKLFRFDTEAGAWKERGVGEIKILRNDEHKLHRVVMRRDQVFKVCTNHVITENTKPEYHLGAQKACSYFIMDYTEGKIPNPEQIAIKFKNEEICKAYMDKFYEIRTTEGFST